MKKFLSVLLALMMVVSTVSFAAPTAVTTADSATDANVVEETTQATTDEVAELSEDSEEYGTLLFDIDFEKYNVDDVVPDNKVVEEYDPDAITNGEFSINWEVGTNKIADDNGNKYIRGGKGWAQFRVQNSDYDAMPKGTYTLIADVIDFGELSRELKAIAQGKGPADAPNVDAEIVAGWSGKNNEWDNVIAKWENIDYSDMTWYFTDKAETEVGFDDIKLYFEPATDAEFSITVDPNGRTDKDAVVKKVHNGESITAGDLAASMPGCVGVSLTVDGEALPSDYTIYPDYNKTVYAVWEYEESEYGTLLFQIDFEKEGISFTDGVSTIPVKDIATTYNKDLVFGNNIFLSAGKKSGSDPLDYREIVKEDGNNYFKADYSDLADREYYTFFSIFEKENKVEWMDGTYTFVADFKTDKPYAGFACHVNNYGDNVKILDDKTSNVNVWDTVAIQYTGAISNDNGNGSLYFAPRIGSKENGYVKGEISVDNIKLFFKTDDTIITLKPNGNRDLSDVVVHVSTSTGITVAELIEEVNKYETTHTLLGISETPTGAVLDPTTKIVPKYQRTFYMIWKRDNENPMLDNQLGKLLFAIDFERAEVIENNWDGYSPFEGGNWGDSEVISKTATLYDTTLFNDSVNSKVRFLTNDRNQKVFDAGIAVSVDGENHFLQGSTGPQSYGDDEDAGTKWPQVGFVNSGNVKAGNGIYTVFLDAMGTGTGGIYPHTNMADYNPKTIDPVTYEEITAWSYTENSWGTYAYTYEITDGAAVPASSIYFAFDDYNKTVAFDNYKLYFKPYTATITLNPGDYPEFGVHYVDGISTTGEDTAQDILDQLADHFKAAGKTAVGLLDEDGFVLDLEADLIIPCDMTYTIIWGEDTHNYVVTQEKNAIRYSSNESRKGIRFLATIAKEDAYNEAVTEYGWIVTRESMLVNAGISPTCFTKESNVAKASGQNYGYPQTGDEDADRKHLNEDENTVLITMVVYGLTEPKQLTENLVARPYMVVDGTTYYGQPWSRSMFDTALALKNSKYPECDENTKAYVDYIINTVLDSSNDIEFDFGEL